MFLYIRNPHPPVQATVVKEDDGSAPGLVFSTAEYFFFVVIFSIYIMQLNPTVWVNPSFIPF